VSEGRACEDYVQTRLGCLSRSPTFGTLELLEQLEQVNLPKRGPVLAVLTLLFFLRVLGQALVAWFEVIWLPAMEHWHSGLIPYPILLTIQLLMLIVMAKITRDIWRGSGFFALVRPSWSRRLICVSAIYAGAMGLRYAWTMAFYPEMRWFGGTIPIFFHFVLAGFVYVVGRFHSRADTFASPKSAC
jgi:hypothetical protein